MNKEREKIIRVKEAIITARSDASLYEIIDKDPAAFAGIRMLYSTDNGGTELQIKNPDSDAFSGIFSKKSLLAYSDNIHNEMTSGKSFITYKRRALFDTNLLSDLPKYFSNKELSTRDKINEVISIVKNEYNGGFDFNFPLLENLREFLKDNNPHPVNKVAAALHLDHLMREKNHENKNTISTLNHHLEQAESIWMNFRSSNAIWGLIDHRDLTYAVLLKTMHICWTKDNLTVEIGLNELTEFCLYELGVLPLKEIYFAWKAIIGFSTNYYPPAFNEQALRSPKIESISRIGALAWDLYIFRFTETLLTEEKGNCFYIPSITTLDKGLLDMIKTCPVKAMIMFEDLGYVETIFDDEIMFQQCLDQAMSTKQKKEILKENRKLNGEKKLRHNVSASIERYEKLIKCMIKSTKTTHQYI